ncbi:hypothetical protein [Nostoc sp.]
MVVADRGEAAKVCVDKYDISCDVQHEIVDIQVASGVGGRGM